MATIVSINISEQKGTRKRPIAEGRLRPDWGIEGDAHAGVWHRQISLLSQESIDKMSALGVPDLKSGDFAENITTQGITLHTLPVGTRLLLGACEVEVTQIGKECHQHCEIFQQVGKCIMPVEGIFVKVVTGGRVRAGDTVSVLPAP
jgi:MOSC domain-containing protein YiiM